MKNIINYLLIFLGLISTDQGLKKIAIESSHYVINKGILLNLFDNTPSHIKIIFLATYSSFLFLVFLVFIATLPKSSFKLKLCLSSIVAGVSSNSIDKIIRGYTIDFIPFYKSSFNLADLYIIIGIIAISIIIILSKKSLLSQKDMRSLNLIEPKAQIQYAQKVAFFVFASSLVLGTLSYTFLITYISPVIINSKNVTSSFLSIYILISTILVIISFPFGLYLSSKIFGPLHGLHIYVEDLARGEKRKFYTREGDKLEKTKAIAKSIERLLK